MLQLLKLSIQKSQIVLLSYNDEGLILEEDWIKIWNELKCSPKIFKKSTLLGCSNISLSTIIFASLKFLFFKKKEIFFIRPLTSFIILQSNGYSFF